MASHEDESTLQVTLSRRRSEKGQDNKARRPVGWKTRQAPKTECLERASGTAVQRRLHGRKAKSSRAKSQRNKSREEASTGTRPREKSVAVKKGRRASVPLLRTSVVSKQRESDSEGAIDTDKKDADSQGAETRVGGARGGARRVGHGRTPLVRSNHSEKWQQAMLRKQQSTIRRGSPMSELQLMRTGSVGVTRSGSHRTEALTQRPECCDIAAAIRCCKKVNTTRPTRHAGPAVKVRDVDNASRVRDKASDVATRPRDKTKSVSIASDVAHGADKTGRAPQRLGRKARPRVAASEPQVPRARRTKAVGAPPRLVRRKMTKKTRSSTEESTDCKVLPHGPSAIKCVKA